MLSVRSPTAYLLGFARSAQPTYLLFGSIAVWNIQPSIFCLLGYNVKCSYVKK